MDDDIRLSEWCRWEERRFLPGIDVGGVYAIAGFSPGATPPGAADPLGGGESFTSESQAGEGTMGSQP